MADDEALIDRVAEDAENRRHELLPANAVGTRPNSKGAGAPRILSVRLSSEQFDKLSADADNAGIPVSTLARMLILQGTSARAPEFPARLLDDAPELMEHLHLMFRSALGSEVQHVVRKSVHEELTKSVRPEFLRETV